jgi:hypothetical protein
MIQQLRLTRRAVARCELRIATRQGTRGDSLNLEDLAMVVSKKTTKSGTAKTQKSTSVDFIELPMKLLTDEEYEAITRANYEHPESRLILQLFLQVNYLWHLSRQMQNKSSSIPVVDWLTVEMTARKTIMATFTKLLLGVDISAWTMCPGAETKKRS